MEKPDFITDGQERTWSNAFTMGFNSLLFLAFGGMFIYNIIRNPAYYGSLIVGLIIWYLVFEITVNAYIRVYYLDGESKAAPQVQFLLPKKDSAHTDPPG